MKPFIKWAGGKRWLLDGHGLQLPVYQGRYFEPFLGGGAVFFHAAPKNAVLSDTNPRLMNVYRAIRSDWTLVHRELKRLQRLHSKEFYYEERSRTRRTLHTEAAQFLYLNRTCFNGLYRENLAGQFNVPMGTKTQVLMPDDDFEAASSTLKSAELKTCDFEETLSDARAGDLVFLDPPYTTAHNMNGFVKYNQKIFSWDDQKRLRDCVEGLVSRGVKVVMTNANHNSIWDLYSNLGAPEIVSRASVISGKNSSRGSTDEALFFF